MRPNEKTRKKSSVSPKMYLVDSTQKLNGYETFCEKLAKGSQGLCISREPFFTIANKPNLEKVTYYQLSPTRGQKALNPTNLGQVEKTIEKFANESEKPAVLIDGVTYLMDMNNVDDIFLLLRQTKEAIASKHGACIIPIDVQSLSPRERSMFLGFFDVVCL